MSAHLLPVSVKIVAVKIEMKNLAMRLRELRRVEKEFAREPQVVTVRTYGRIRHDEKTRIGYFFRAGIPAVQVAARFCCSVPTVYNCARQY